MRIVLVISALFFCGCAASHHQAKLPVVLETTILDAALTKPEYADAIRQAERDLPEDRWEDFKGHWNASRSLREHDVAFRMLAEIKPRLQAMSVTELVRSFKVVPYPAGLLTNSFPGVRGDIYELGNLTISKEIKSRPKSELEILPGLADDHVAIWTGPNGPVTTLAGFVQYDVHDK